MIDGLLSCAMYLLHDGFRSVVQDIYITARSESFHIIRGKAVLPDYEYPMDSGKIRSPISGRKDRTRDRLKARKGGGNSLWR